MNPDRPKRLRMIAGPNGSGKSSIIRNLAKERSADGVFWLNHYLNADDVERGLITTGLDLSQFDLEITLPKLCDALREGKRIPHDHQFFTTAKLEDSILRSPRGNGYLAASIVDFLREELMRRGSSFSYETVMSHLSKVEFFGRARAEGYKTYLYFVCTNSAELNVARVRSRVRAGGHAVPEDKIRERYIRCLELTREAIANSYRAYVFDNSGPEPIRLDAAQQLLRPFMTKTQWHVSEYKAYASVQVELAIARRDFTAARNSIGLLKQFADGDARINRLEERVAWMEMRDPALMLRRMS